MLKVKDPLPMPYLKPGCDDWEDTPLYRMIAHKSDLHAAVKLSDEKLVKIWTKKFKVVKLNSLEHLVQQSSATQELEYYTHLLHHKDCSGVELKQIHKRCAYTVLWLLVQMNRQKMFSKVMHDFRIMNSADYPAMK